MVDLIIPWVAWWALWKAGTITASYATGDVDGGDGDNDRCGWPGGLYGKRHPHRQLRHRHSQWRGWTFSIAWVAWWAICLPGTITASYATGTVNGGDGDEDSVGGLVGSGMAPSPPATPPAQSMAGMEMGIPWVAWWAGWIAAKRHPHRQLRLWHQVRWRSHKDRFLRRLQHTHDPNRRHHEANRRHQCDGADRRQCGGMNGTPPPAVPWVPGASADSNQPPALVYNDYDGTPDSNDIDYCARFTAVDIPCGALLPGQRADTTPQVGTTSSDIQLTTGDTADSITGNITLPATLTVGENSLDLMWSVHHDPETTTTPTRSPSAAGSLSSMPVIAPPAVGFSCAPPPAAVVTQPSSMITACALYKTRDMWGRT